MIIKPHPNTPVAVPLSASKSEGPSLEKKEGSDRESFEEWVIRMVETEQTKSPDFQAVLKYFGRERLADIWRKYQGNI